MKIKVLKTLSEIKYQYETTINKINDLKEKQKALKRIGIDYGSPHWKEKRYLRIVRAATDEQPRQYEYIGSDIKRQEQALAALERGKEYDLIQQELSTLISALNKLNEDLIFVLEKLTGTGYK